MTFRFSTEGTGFRYLSNQFVRLALPGVADPWGPVRSFSLSSSPSEAGFIAITCKISDTPFKQALAAMRPGETGTVFGPLGSFLFDDQRPGVFLAGGIGITPLRGMIRFAHDTSFRHEMVLLYSARTPEELVFQWELDAIAKVDHRLRPHYSITRPHDARTPWAGRVGRIDAEWIREATRDLHDPRFYLCGLPEMVGQMVQTLQVALGVPSESVDYEVFRGF
jgi:glycine betaine catabolism B